MAALTVDFSDKITVNGKSYVRLLQNGAPAPKAAAAPGTRPFHKNTRVSHGNLDWTEADDAMLIDLTGKGSSGRQIAKAVGRTASAVYSRLWALRKSGKISTKPA